MGFINPPLTVRESASILLLQVGVLEGTLQSEVVLNISTTEKDATGIITNMLFSILIIIIYRWHGF